MELLTVDETARMLQLSPRTVRRFISSGRLISFKKDHRRWIERTAIERFMRRYTPPSADVDDVTGDLPEELANARPLAPDDPIFGLIGIGRSDSTSDVSDGTNDVSANKHKYLAEGYLRVHMGK